MGVCIGAVGGGREGVCQVRAGWGWDVGLADAFSFSLIVSLLFSRRRWAEVECAGWFMCRVSV